MVKVFSAMEHFKNKKPTLKFMITIKKNGVVDKNGLHYALVTDIDVLDIIIEILIKHYSNKKFGAELKTEDLTKWHRNEIIKTSSRLRYVIDYRKSISSDSL